MEVNKPKFREVKELAAGHIVVIWKNCEGRCPNSTKQAVRAQNLEFSVDVRESQRSKRGRPGREKEGRTGASVLRWRQVQSGRVSARGHHTLGGRAKRTGSRASGTSGSSSRRRALHTFLASAASAAIRAIAETRAARLPLACGQRPKSPKGRGGAKWNRAPWARDKEQEKGPRVPLHTLADPRPTLDSRGK